MQSGAAVLSNDPMPSFDVVSKLEHHEVDNALDQARREVSTRFDFKGTDVDQPRNLAKTVTVE